jgi:hypothetical protein
MLGGNIMNKTKEQLIEELSRIERKDFIEQLKKDQNGFSLYLIKMNCIKNKCANFNVLEYKDDAFFICYDDWSCEKVGWHVIYFETLDLCFEHKKEEYLKG